MPRALHIILQLDLLTPLSNSAECLISNGLSSTYRQLRDGRFNWAFPEADVRFWEDPDEVSRHRGQTRAVTLAELTYFGHHGRMYAETERAGLSEFLDMQREALIEKLHGASDDDARRAPTVSSLSRY